MKEFNNGIEANWDLIDEDGMDVFLFIYNIWNKKGECMYLNHKSKKEIIDMCTPIDGKTRILVNLNAKEVMLFKIL